MAEEQIKLISNFEARVRQLMHLCDSLKEENAQIRTTVSAKDEKIQKLEATFNELSTKYENLKLAQGFSLTEEERRTAKARYTKLVREIDKCIGLLNE
jgi:predicted nuclease with TOPRIM domain